MDKIDCIEDYFASIRAYYLFQIGKFFNIPEYKDYILDKNCLNGTRIAFISNLMLATKENLVDNKGNMQYESKVFLEKLENSVTSVATKVKDGYKLGNYTFPDAATLVAIVRNKLAHGKYRIDFKHNRVILEHKGVDIVINIERLVIFVLTAFSSTLKSRKNTTYERNILYYRYNTNNIKKIKDESVIRKVIKNYNYVSFKIESLNGMPIFEDCIQYLEGFIKYFERDAYVATKSDFYRDLVKYLECRNCKLKIEYQTLRDKEAIDQIIKYASSELVGNENLSAIDQVKIIGLEVQKRLNGGYKNFDAVFANISNLILVESISNSGSVEDQKLHALIGKICPAGLKIGYDEFGMTLLAMFNALFIYPFDDVYDTSGEYSSVRNNVLDFSILDLSMVNPDVITIDDAPLINAKDKLDSIVKKQVQTTKKILQQESNLSKVSGNVKAETNINNSLKDLRLSLSNSITEYMLTDSQYRTIRDDYTVNHMYFRNKAIIEGIRNSIAHGHYEIVSNGDVWSTEIVFSDIYEGKLTFQVKITFEELATLIEENYNRVLNYVKNKNSSIKKKLI